MDNVVVPLFGQAPVVSEPEVKEPEKTGEEWMQAFIEDTLSQSLYLLQQIHDAADEQEFKQAARTFQRHVATWQV